MKLRALLAEPRLRVMPCCWDALSARLIERSGFPLTFMSGFAVSAARLALPDTQLISYAEMLDTGRALCAAVSIPVIGDADTGYGNALNVKRTIAGYAQAGFAAAMIEDQLAPKRCGHTRGKDVVSRGEALARIRAAVDARDEGAGILILARTDAAAVSGLDEAIARARAFRDAGADILFVEAPRSEAELERVARALEGAVVMANLVEGGRHAAAAAGAARGARLPHRGLSAHAALGGGACAGARAGGAASGPPSRRTRARLVRSAARTGGLPGLRRGGEALRDGRRLVQAPQRGARSEPKANGVTTAALGATCRLRLTHPGSLS